MSADGLQGDVPPVGEEIHLPGPSMIPIVNAFGVALTLLGLLLWIPITFVGLIIFVISTIRWVRDTRRYIDALPLDHP